MQKVLVTGAAGFIGFHLALRLLNDGVDVIGVDDMNPYYDPRLKRDRLELLEQCERFEFHEFNLADRTRTAELFADRRPTVVAHLAAQAGVRCSLENPAAYIDSNLVAFGAVLEGCRAAEVEHLVFASSSSVYGNSAQLPTGIGADVDHPISLYAATKRANELMAHTYSHLYRLPCTGLRFFTVYGPWGRPDMALFKFTEAVIAGRPIDVYNEGRLKRDFTYVDDVVEGVVRVLRQPPEPPGEGDPPFGLHNIGNQQPVELGRFIAAIERAVGRPAQLNLLPMQPGDVLATWADVSGLVEAVGYEPNTSIEDGVAKFVQWYREWSQ